MGDDSSTRRPTADTILSMMCIRWALSLNTTLVFSSTPAALHIHRVVGVDQDVVDGGVLQQRLQRPQAEDLVQHLARQPVALAGAEGNVLFAHQLHG